MTAIDVGSLDALFAPRSLAVIGASADPARIGGRPIAHALEQGFAHPIYPVNPGRDEVQGLPAYKSLLDIPGEVDCAILALPDRLVVQAVRDCAAKGVRAVVVFSGGFAETGLAGLAAQQEMAAIARAAGMRLLGPNCIGACNAATNAHLTFLRGIQPGFSADAYNFGLVSQSGGYGSHILQLGTQRGLRISQWATTGNEADIEFGEVLAWLAGSPAVDAILGYIEGVRSAASLLAGLEIAHRRGKPVIVMKVGATEAGAAAAASHTASLAGADALYDAVFRDYGVFRASCTEEVLDVAAALRAGRMPRSRSVGVLSVSGGAGVQIADFASAAGLSLPPPAEAVQQALRAIAPFGSPANPVDITAQFINQPDMVWRSMRLLLEAGYDSVIAWLTAGPSLASARDQMLAELGRLPAEFPDQVHVLCLTVEAELAAAYAERGFLIFEEPKRAVVALAALAQFRACFARGLPDRTPPTDAIRLSAATRLNEVEGKALLARCGIAAPQEAVATTPALAGAAAMHFGRPVALKILSPDIQHKTEVGGVALGLSPEAVEPAALRMGQEVARHAPDARLDGFLVSPMLDRGVECIVGTHRDPLFGPVVMFGIGGVLVEVLKDVAFSLAPVDAERALAMVRSVRGFPLLAGHRGQPAADVAALAAALVSLSRLAAGNADHVQTIEVNPLLVLAEGQGVVALDAVVGTL